MEFCEFVSRKNLQPLVTLVTNSDVIAHPDIFWQNSDLIVTRDRRQIFIFLAISCWFFMEEYPISLFRETFCYVSIGTIWLFYFFTYLGASKIHPLINGEAGYTWCISIKERVHPNKTGYSQYEDIVVHTFVQVFADNLIIDKPVFLSVYNV